VGAANAGKAPTPAKSSQVYPDNAIFWDAPVIVGGTDSLSLFNWSFSGLDCDYLGNFPTYGVSFGNGSRYRESASLFQDDPFEGDGFPVAYLAPGILKQGGGSVDIHNADSVQGPNGYTINIWGNLRFRHGDDVIANTLFADGSARGLRLFPNRPHPMGGFWSDSEFLRSYYRIKPHTNVKF
jgi:prepilin-type processing-associated H-X9-DG protein